MRKGGRALADVRAAIDAKYGPIGPPTATPMPPR